MRVLHLEPKRAAATIANVFMAMVAIGVVVSALLYRTDSWPQRWRFEPEVSERTPLIVAAVAAFIAVLSIGGAIVNGRRWHIARVVERLSDDPRFASLLPETDWSSPRNTARNVPELSVSVVTARKVAKPRAKFRRVSPQHNVIGRPPLQIAYLRLFENHPRIRTFMEGAWREFGYVYLLRSAASVTPAEYRLAKRSKNLPGMFLSSPDDFLGSLKGKGVHRKGRHRLKSIGPRAITVRDRYGSYRVHALLCHGAFWKTAVDMLLDRVDIVVLDLSGFRPENRGTQYELQRVIDRFPVERVLFLGDPASNKKFLTEQLREAWSGMAAGSPNAGRGDKTAVIVITDSIVRRQTSQTSHAGATSGTASAQQQQVQVQTRLVARRRETRRVMAIAQTRLPGIGSADPHGS